MNYYDSMVLVKITGKNVKKFILNLRYSHIPLYQIKIIDRNTATIKISYDDYLKLKELRSAYEISKLKEYGYINIKNKVRNNIPFLLGIILSLILLSLLSNIIFKIEVIHTNKEIKKIIINELEEKGVKKYRFKKNYETIESIEDEILKKHKDKLEWLEIIENGTTYMIKLEMRKIINPSNDNLPTNIVAKKNAVIKKIIASSGLIIKSVNDYVEKGEVIISGNILKDENIVASVKASGQVFGEVWYTVNVEQPFNYQEDILKNEYQQNFKFSFLNKDFYFIKKKYKLYKEHNINNFINSRLPLSFSFVKIQKIVRKDFIYNYDQALKQALKVGEEKLKATLGKEDKILSQKTLKNYQKNSKIVVDIFYSVYEDITDTRNIVVEEKIGE